MSPATHPNILHNDKEPAMKIAGFLLNCNNLDKKRAADQTGEISRPEGSTQVGETPEEHSHIIQ